MNSNNKSFYKYLIENTKEMPQQHIQHIQPIQNNKNTNNTNHETPANNDLYNKIKSAKSIITERENYLQEKYIIDKKRWADATKRYRQLILEEIVEIDKTEDYRTNKTGQIYLKRFGKITTESKTKYKSSHDTDMNNTGEDIDVDTYTIDSPMEDIHTYSQYNINHFINNAGNNSIDDEDEDEEEKDNDNNNEIDNYDNMNDDPEFTIWQIHYGLHCETGAYSPPNNDEKTYPRFPFNTKEPPFRKIQKELLKRTGRYLYDFSYYDRYGDNQFVPKIVVQSKSKPIYWNEEYYQSLHNYNTLGDSEEYKSRRVEKQS